MKKRYLVIALGISAAASYLFNAKGNGRKLMEKMKSMVNNKNQQTPGSTLEQAGVPDQLEIKDSAQVENAKMVSEGSQYGVQYYNEVMEEKE